MPRRLLPALVLLVLAGPPAAPAAAAVLSEGGTALVGAAASGSSTPLPIPVAQSELRPDGVSQDGRYVAFSSYADGLSPLDDDRIGSVYVKDRTTGAVELVSRASGAGGAPDASGCREASISDDGTRVAFTCSAPLDPADTNGASDVYLRDRTANTTVLVSRAAAVGNAGSHDPQLSGNGAHVVFSSTATNLAGPAQSGLHVYRRTLGSGDAVVRVDVPNSGPPVAGGGSHPTISDDGQRVAFESTASGLVAGTTDANSVTDVYWRNLAAGTTALVSSVSGAPTQAAAGPADGPAISGNGLFVAYASSAANIGDGDADTTGNIHRRTLSNAVVVLVDRATGAAGAKAQGYQYAPSLDDSGDAASFVSNDAALHPAAGVTRQVHLRRVGAGTTELVSRASGNGTAAGDDVAIAGVSGNGGAVALQATGLTPDADPLLDAVFVRDVTAADRPTTLVSRPPGAEPFINQGASAHVVPGGLSANGRYTAFVSDAPGLPGHPGGGIDAVWRRDGLTGEVVLVSRADGPAGAPANGSSYGATISADGNRIAFVAQATNLGPGGDGVHVRDVAAATTTRASRASGAAGAPADSVDDAAISADGRRVAFVSPSAVLGAQGKDHVFVRDLETATTTAVAPTQPGLATAPRLDASGSRIVWKTELPGNKGMSKESHTWVADVAGGTPVKLEAGSSSAEADNPAISADGTRASFSTEEALVPGDDNGDSDVYVRQLATGALTLASSTGAAGPSSGSAYVSQLSADGRRIAFESGATNLAPADTDSASDLFVRDLDSGTMTLASRADGVAGAGLELGVQSFAIDATAGCVVFSSRDTTLAPGLSFDVFRVWQRAVRGTCPSSVAAAPSPGGDAPGGPPAVVWRKPARPVVGRLTARPARFSTRGRKAGTTLTFTLDRAAKVSVVVTRVGRGHRVGKACRAGAPRKRTRQRPCVRLKRVITMSRVGEKGMNRVVFSGRVRGRRLAKGTYRATVVATADGLRSVARTAKLTIT